MERETDFEYTMHAKERISKGFKDDLNSFYCREDFTDVLEKFDKGEQDNKLAWAGELKKMCKARGVDFENLKTKSPERKQELAKVPTREELLDDLIEMLYQNYKKCYSSENFMTRIVRRLAPEYAEDPVRVAILKKFILGAGFQWENRLKDDSKDPKDSEYATGAVIKWAEARFSDEESERYESLTNQEEKLKMLVGKLDDSIFSEKNLNSEEETESLDNLNSEELANPGLFLLIVDVLNNWILGGEKANRIKITTDTKAVQAQKKGERTIGDDQMEYLEDITLDSTTLDAIRNFCNKNDLDYDNTNDSGKNLSILNEIRGAIECNELSEQEKATLMETVFPLLEKDFREFRKNKYYKNRNGKLQTLSELYKNSYSERENKLKKSSEQGNSTSGDEDIRSICDDYAKGTFRNKSNFRKTRIRLYYFAMMFDMTVTASETEDPDPKTDVDKNLFRDYYNDNVLRYLASAGTKEENQGLESEPRGDGINYKNYEETIYLYFLYHKDLGNNPGDRIDQAEELIKNCEDIVEKGKPQAKAAKKREEAAREDFTEFAQTEYFYPMLQIDKDQLVNYILEDDKYRLRSSDKKGIKIASEQVGAFENIRPDRETAFFDSWELDSSLKSRKNEWLWIIPNLLQEVTRYSKYKDDETFMRIVNTLTKKLASPNRSSGFSMSDKKVSRNAYLSMFLYSYIQKVKAKEIDLRGLTFPEIFDDFCIQANLWLKERFQPFNGTNLVDLYVFLIYYMYLVKNIEVLDLEGVLKKDLEKLYKSERVTEQSERQTGPQREKEEALPEETER